MLGVQGLGPRLGDGAGSAGWIAAREEPGRLLTLHREASPAGATPEQRDVPEEPPDRRAEREAWLILVTVPGLGPVTFARLVAAFGSGRAVLDAAAQHRPRDPLTPELARKIEAHAGQGRQLIDRVRGLGLRVVTLEDEEYPPRLRAVEIPPPLLFVRGNVDALAAAHSVAVVGTRAPTDRGRRIAAWIASAVSRAGAVVVSGLAIGIDGAAHAAAVAEGLPTVAVLGGGHARLFPRAHERLADAIVDAGGAVVAELPPDTPATRGTFPRRNRLISGLSDASVVVEAGRRSGALITAGWALEQGRACFVVPGPLDSAASAGCHAFLREFGSEVQIVAGIPELIEDLGLAGDGAAADGVGETAAQVPTGRTDGRAKRAAPAAVLAGLAPTERAVAEVIAAGPATADAVAAATGLPIATVLGALTLLELRGLVTAGYGRYFPGAALLAWVGPERGGRDAVRRRGAAERGGAERSG